MLLISAAHQEDVQLLFFQFPVLLLNTVKQTVLHYQPLELMPHPREDYLLQFQVN